MDVTLHCPRCRRALVVALAEMVPGGTRTCTACGAAIRFAGADASRVQSLIDQAGALPQARIKVTVRQKVRPWWKFWGRSSGT